MRANQLVRAAMELLNSGRDFMVLQSRFQLDFKARGDVHPKKKRLLFETLKKTQLTFSGNDVNKLLASSMRRIL